MTLLPLPTTLRILTHEVSALNEWDAVTRVVIEGGRSQPSGGRQWDNASMDDTAKYLPEIYRSFRDRFADVVERNDAVAEAVDAAGPLDEQTIRLVKLGIAVGAQSEGAVRSNVRKSLDAGSSQEAIEQVILLGLTTRGFPATVAAWQWASEVWTSHEDLA